MSQPTYNFNDILFDNLINTSTTQANKVNQYSSSQTGYNITADKRNDK